MSNPYANPSSGWIFESGICKETENALWKFYVDSPSGPLLYDANPDQLHAALIKNVDNDYMPDDDADAQDCEIFVSELIGSYLSACEHNANPG